MTDTVPALLIGAREADPNRRPIPGSEPRPCAECSEPTMFSPATLGRGEEHPGSRFVCVECAAGRDLLSGLVLLPPDGTQTRELAAAGHDAEAWPLRSEWAKKLQRRDSGGSR